MHRVLSTYLFVHRKLSAATLSEIAGAGIPAIELFCSRPHFDYRSAQDVRELADWLAGHRLALHSVHAPTERDASANRESGVPLSISDTERGRRLDAVDEIKRAVDLAEVIPFRFLVQHIASSRDPMDPRKWDAAFSSLEHLTLFAKQRGVTIALENTPGEMASPANLRLFIQQTRLQHLRLCFDTGHAHLEDGVGPAFDAVREFVVTTHVHDNRGEKDEHLLPFEGTIDWKATMKKLGSSLPLVMELKEITAQGHPAALAAAAFEKLGQAMKAKA
jgi:sugar phosphate isomerase/epimerase